MRISKSERKDRITEIMPVNHKASVAQEADNLSDEKGGDGWGILLFIQPELTHGSYIPLLHNNRVYEQRLGSCSCHINSCS